MSLPRYARGHQDAARLRGPRDGRGEPSARALPSLAAAGRIWAAAQRLPCVMVLRTSAKRCVHCPARYLPRPARTPSVARRICAAHGAEIFGCFLVAFPAARAAFLRAAFAF